GSPDRSAGGSGDFAELGPVDPVGHGVDRHPAGVVLAADQGRWAASAVQVRYLNLASVEVGPVDLARRRIKRDPARAAAAAPQGRGAAGAVQVPDLNGIAALITQVNAVRGAR